jgi:drug/metabolite transporter (DMT)-like permease
MGATNNTPRAAGMLLFTTLAWGAMFAVGKSALGAIDAFWLSALRYVPASLAMLAILAYIEGRRALSLRDSGVRLWLYGSLGFAGFSILGFLGLTRSRPEHAAIIVALMPLITALMSWLLRGVRPRPITFGAMLAALAGVALVITKGSLRLQGAATLDADALMFAGVACWVAYTMGASSFPGTSPLRYTALSMALGTVTIVAVTLAATLTGLAHRPALDVVSPVTAEIAYLSLIGGVLAVLAWNAGIAILGPANGVLFINLVPITAFAIGVAQGHHFGAGEIVGVALVVGALLTNNLATRAPASQVASRHKFA